MKKALRIVAITAGIISIVAALILGCIYLENVVEYLSGMKNKFVDRFGKKDILED